MILTEVDVVDRLSRPVDPNGQIGRRGRGVRRGRRNLKKFFLVGHQIF